VAIRGELLPKKGMDIGFLLDFRPDEYYNLTISNQLLIPIPNH